MPSPRALLLAAAASIAGCTKATFEPTQYDAQQYEVRDLGTPGGNAVTGGLNKHGVVAGWSWGADGVAHAMIFTPPKK